MAKSKSAPKKAAAAKPSASKFNLVGELTKAGFTEGEAGKYSKGSNRVEIQHVPNGAKPAIEHHRYFTEAGGASPVFHTDSGVRPSKDFLADFLK